MMNRDESKAADALAKAVSNRGWNRHAFFIRVSEMPAYVIREIFGLFVSWVRVIAEDSRNGQQYHVWPDDVASDARIIWDRISNLYEDEPRL